VAEAVQEVSLFLEWSLLLLLLVLVLLLLLLL
jgi:hypothetical protein